MNKKYKVLISVGVVLVLAFLANWLVVYTALYTMKNEAVQTLDWTFNEYTILEKSSPDLKAAYSKIVLSKLVKIHSVDLSPNDVYGNSKKAICKMNFDLYLKSLLKEDKRNEYLTLYLDSLWKEVESSFKENKSSCEFDLSSISRNKKQ